MTVAIQQVWCVSLLLALLYGVAVTSDSQGQAPNFGLPQELGQRVNGFQDDFDSPNRNPDWKAYGSGGDRYEQSDGLLRVSAQNGDPNHLPNNF
ncbi:MAG: hypothetical protein FJ403_05255 [Verrucomicrobia bacterium]|nr:hypothetical protein [Verrucomicrobiota bacterium]